ncbi:GNAT family N-acetyltransferase [Pseudoalteromonas sp. NBT06-2]|uniref:GNAT family N-acetyltransferase n=1 Tax=Pseudoalteromonas sp. NBT06-2 TaxID=2025950 RepID=UPI000BA6EC6B|nr:GNAT family N-acetyltransferase [Pseudoalteromonas sp. NBT06-2]PAJ73983.1 GNAT family N-acetyltransferase [Pseudoalteromonas sp. NBT06-2]
MFIKQATHKDVNEISELISRLSLKYIAPNCSDQGIELLIESMKPNSLTQYMNTNYLYHIIKDDNVLVGVIAIRDNSHLFHMFVADTYQGKGIAKKLWLYAKGVCFKNGNVGKFTVNSALNAKSVYLKLGFKPIAGIRENKGVKDIPMILHELTD